MDRFLIDYLRSGYAWVLVGSGPSTEMDYPSWRKLANVAINTVKTDLPGDSFRNLEDASSKSDFPGVFEEAKRIIGAPRLLQSLREELKPSRTAEIYKLICRWPVPVYLTTNYDDELQTQLTSQGETYISYTNSEEHMASLLPDLQGAIFKLHGDLRSEKGLILDRSHYKEIQSDVAWRYWRTKMTSIFQMTRVVVVGHSLSDPNFQHILRAAKEGAGVELPICWIAPDIEVEKAREYLENFRIRVISYNNQDGDHANLLRLLEQITDFIPARTSISISDFGRRIVEHTDNTASAFFVFNRLTALTDYHQIQKEILSAAIESVAPKLAEIPIFTIKTALDLAGWPEHVPLPSEVETDVGAMVLESGLLVKQDDSYTLGSRGLESSDNNRRAFTHTRNRFFAAVVRRIKADFQGVDTERANQLAQDIEDALTGYFKEGGLTLASLLFSDGSTHGRPQVPPSILHFINDASAKYSDLLDRQVFITTSIRVFTHAGSAERDYLGRLAQGFFGFHALGAFGDVAVERLKQAKNTVWLLDSNVQIAMLATGSVTSAMWQECVQRLVASGIRFFTLESLFSETRVHWWFANKMTEEYGSGSRMVVAAALGEAPFRRSNLFLEGFIRWQAAGNPADWESYMFQVFGARKPSEEDIRKRLIEMGIEVLPFSDWPGLKDQDHANKEEYIKDIASLRKPAIHTSEMSTLVHLSDPFRKAVPEAECLIIVREERKANYHMLSGMDVKSPAWFVSDTSILNAIETGPRITWQPDAFLRFAATLPAAEGGATGEHAFDTLLWGLAQSGLSLLDEKMAENVLGGIIDQSSIDLQEMKQLYEDTLAQKYGEPLESVMDKIAPIDRPLATLQLVREIEQVQISRRESAESRAEKEKHRAETAEKELVKVERYRKRMKKKMEQGQRKARKQKTKSQSRQRRRGRK